MRVPCAGLGEPHLVSKHFVFQIWEAPTDENQWGCFLWARKPGRLAIGSGLEIGGCPRHNTFPRSRWSTLNQEPPLLDQLQTAALLLLPCQSCRRTWNTRIFGTLPSPPGPLLYVHGCWSGEHSQEGGWVFSVVSQDCLVLYFRVGFALFILWKGLLLAGFWFLPSQDFLSWLSWGNWDFSTLSESLLLCCTQLTPPLLTDLFVSYWYCNQRIHMWNH